MRCDSRCESGSSCKLGKLLWRVQCIAYENKYQIGAKRHVRIHLHTLDRLADVLTRRL